MNVRAEKIERKKRFVEAVNSLNIRFVGREIADTTGYKPGTVSVYLNIEEEELSESFVRKVCEKFGLNFKEIWNGGETKKASTPIREDDRERLIQSKESEIAALKETITLLRHQLDVNSKLLSHSATVVHARLRTILECQKLLRSRALKESFEVASQQVDKQFEEILETIVHGQI